MDVSFLFVPYFIFQYEWVIYDAFQILTLENKFRENSLHFLVSRRKFPLEITNCQGNLNSFNATPWYRTTVLKVPKFNPFEMIGTLGSQAKN